MTLPFTPLEALDMGEGIHGEYEITLDGPQGSPSSHWTPFVFHGDDVYAVSGEEGDPVTANSVWIKQCLS